MKKKYLVEYTVVGKHNPFFRTAVVEVESLGDIVRAVWMQYLNLNEPSIAVGVSETDIIPTLIELK